MSTESLLTEIRDALQQLVAVSKAAPAKPQKPPPMVAWPGERTVAPDSELDGKYGDPVIKTAPRDWNGPFRSGQAMSESEPELLELVAERCDYFAQKNDRERQVTDQGVPKSKYDRSKAAKARGWAARIRKGYKPTITSMTDEVPDWVGSDDPF